MAGVCDHRRMNRDTSRTAARLVGALIALVALAIGVWRWRSPALPAPLPAPSALASARPVFAPTGPRPPPLRLMPAVAEPDAARVVGVFDGRVLSSETGQGVPGAELTF